MREYTVGPGEDIQLGHRWEHHARRIVFDISEWVKDFGAGTVQLLNQRQSDASPYPVAVTRTDADGVTVNNMAGVLVLWDVTNVDTNCQSSRAELRYYRGTEAAPEFLVKSDIHRATVEDALGAAVADAPDEGADWLATLLDASQYLDSLDLDGLSGQVSAALEAASEASEAADAAQTAARSLAEASQRISALESEKVDKEDGKGLSDNNYSDADKAKVAAALTQHQDISGKVDKEAGKGLSTNDYTDAEKTKLSGIAAQANKTIIDTTLSNAGQAADAKTTGDSFSALHNLISRMEIYCTASGNPATFSDADAANMKNLRVTLTPTQSGSGDPSPTNIRPISGVSSVSVTRTGQNGANSQTVTVQLTDGSNPLTVYGGTLDVTAGTLSVTHKVFEFNTADMDNDTENFPGWKSIPGILNVVPTGYNDTIYNAICNIAPYVAANTTSAQSVIWVGGTGKQQSELKAMALPVTVVAPLLTPVTYQLTPQQLATLAGYNSVTTDAGTVSVTYKANASLLYEALTYLILSLGGNTP